MDRPAPSFSPAKAMWLSLPGAALCSLPIGYILSPRLLPGFSFSRMTVFSFGSIFLVVLIPVAAVTTGMAYRYCASTTGFPGTRMVLMLFNFIACGFAYACVLIFVLVVILMIVGMATA